MSLSTLWRLNLFPCMGSSGSMSLQRSSAVTFRGEAASTKSRKNVSKWISQHFAKYTMRRLKCMRRLKVLSAWVYPAESGFRDYSEGSSHMRHRSSHNYCNYLTAQLTFKSW